MISRLTSEARMPSWPIEMPSLTAMVMNSNGNPPAARTPSFDRLANRSSGRLQGVTSFQDDATPICGLSQSSSVMPIGPQHRSGRRPRGPLGHLSGAGADVDRSTVGVSHGDRVRPRSHQTSNAIKDAGASR